MSGKRTEMRRPAVKMTAAMPAAEMVSTPAMMTAAAPPAVAATVTAAVATSMTTAASCNCKVRHGQHRCKNNRGNSQRDL